MNHWLVKVEPDAYSWSTFVNEGRTAWTGVRNFQARNNLRAMKRGDLACYYHTGEEKQVVGLARVDQEAYADPTADEGDWVCVDLVPVKPLAKPVSLAAVKGDAVLKEIPLARNPRLSVSPLTKVQFERLMKLAGG
jgi:predicted RNA-binding protein with PUA-like domain